jgi:hypothetical protein
MPDTYLVERRDHLEARLNSFAHVLIESVDDVVHGRYGTHRLITPVSDETRAALLADYTRQLERQGITGTEQRRRRAAYQRYLTSFEQAVSDDSVPLMSNPRPSWRTVRSLLHDRAKALAREASHPDWPLAEEE